jgi:hypothetical protein
VARVVQMGGFVTFVTLGGFMLAMFRRDAKKDTQPGTDKKVNG